MNTLRLGDILEIQNGFAFDSEFFSENDGMPLIRIRDLKEGIVTDIKYKGKFDESFRVKRGDYLIGMDGEFRCYKWKGEDALLNQRVCRLIQFEQSVFPEYIFYGINLHLAKIERNTAFVTVKHISSKQIKEIKFPFPSLEDQIRIANILRKGEALISQRKESIHLLDEFLKSTFLEMFGDPVSNEKGYKVKSIEEASENIFLGLTSKVEYVEDGGFPLVRATDIRDGKLSFDKVKYISEKQHKLITQNRITKRGDLLISKSGSLGTCAIVDTDIPFTTYESIITIQVNPELLNNRYIMFLIRNSNFQIKMLGGKVGGTVGHLNLQMFRNMQMPLPPIKLQAQFAQIVEKTEALKAQYQTSLQELENLYGSLSQRAFKGELNLK